MASVFPCVAGSGLAHAALLGAAVLFSPPLGDTPEDASDAQTYLLRYDFDATAAADELAAEEQAFVAGSQGDHGSRGR